MKGNINVTLVLWEQTWQIEAREEVAP